MSEKLGLPCYVDYQTALNVTNKQYMKKVFNEFGVPTAKHAVMGGAVYCITFLNLPAIITLLIQVPLGVLIYVLGSIVFKNEEFGYILNIIKGIMRKDSRTDSE